jgi:hypothetical protein
LYEAATILNTTHDQGEFHFHGAWGQRVDMEHWQRRTDFLLLQRSEETNTWTSAVSLSPGMPRAEIQVLYSSLSWSEEWHHEECDTEEECRDIWGPG